MNRSESSIAYCRIWCTASWDAEYSNFEKRNKFPSSANHIQIPFSLICHNNTLLSCGLCNLTDDGIDFPLAYIILVEAEDAQQVERLLYSIYTPHNFYCLHVDKSVRRQIVDTFRLLTSCFHNVFLARSGCAVEFEFPTFHVETRRQIISSCTFITKNLKVLQHFLGLAPVNV